jgi:AcrR family transcriptional regulator
MAPAATTPKNRTKQKAVRVLQKDSAANASDARDRLIATARKLFYTEGPRAVGIDRVLAESGVAKMSLYRHFGSKDELIVACLKAQECEYWQLWENELDLEADAPTQLRNAIRFIAKRTSHPSYHGNLFLNTAQSFPDPQHPAHLASIENRQHLASRLLKLCRAARARSPQALARQLMLLINGAQVTAGMLGKETQHAIIGAAEALFQAQGIGD